jgi:hypothetical protein
VFKEHCIDGRLRVTLAPSVGGNFNLPERMRYLFTFHYYFLPPKIDPGNSEEGKLNVKK